MGENGLPGESSKLILFFDRLPQMSGASERAISQAWTQRQPETPENARGSLLILING